MLNIKFTNATNVELVTVGNPNTITYTLNNNEFSCSDNIFSKDDKNYYHFAITGTNVQLSGTIGEVTEAYQYFKLFEGQTAITDASNLTLSSVVAKEFCYANMFLDCTNLTSPPTIEATTLAKWCYSSMFGNCSSLSAAPALVATELAPFCYYCMFYGCKSLTDSPELPAQSLYSWSYNSMFYKCSNLSSIDASMSAWNGNATSSWVTKVAKHGYFYNTTVEEIYGNSNIPEGW